jgi:heptosyltransferase-2
MHFPDAQIDFLVRKGNETLFNHHPYLHEVLIWDKKKNKQRNLWKLLKKIRHTKYDKVINVQRFAATGLLTAFSGAKEKIGFDKNPFSLFFTKKIAHRVDEREKITHEIERDLELINDFTDDSVVLPRLYPSAADYESVQLYRQEKYISIAPASVWFTKQYPEEKWISFINKLPPGYAVFLLGAPGDSGLCERIISTSGYAGLQNLCGKLSFLQSAALMKNAVMNYVNDSAPMHFASAVNAPVTAVYCSTIPAFGFGPLSDKKGIVEIKEPLDCRPCGLHGYKACPLGHFNCAYRIEDEQLLRSIKN